MRQWQRAVRRVASGLTAALWVAQARAQGAPATAVAAAASAVPAVPAVRTTTLAEAVAYARERQPLLLAQRARIEALRAEARVPRSQWLPTVGAFAELVGSTVNNSTATVINNAQVDLPRIGATPVRGTPSWRPYPTTLAAVGLRQQLYDFGRTDAQTEALAALARAEAARTEGARLDVEQAVTQAYYGVLAARGLVGAADGALARARGRRDFVKATTEGGLRPPIDRTRAEADMARFEVSKLRAEGALRMARMRLALAMGTPEPEVDAVEAPTPAAAPAEAQVEAQVEANDTLVREARARLDAQAAQTRAVEALARPSFFLTASLSGRAGGAQPSSGPLPTGDGWLPLVPNYSAGVVLSVPLYDPGVNARADASRAREYALRLDIDLARLRAVSTARQAYRSLELADTARPALERALAAAKANYDQAEARFKAGLGTATELADAEALRTEAEVQLSLGRYESLRARAALGRALSEGTTP